jgi:transposase InsO family protein
MDAGLSERKACDYIGIRRSSRRYERRPDRNAALRARLCEMAKPGVGYRQAWARLRGEFPGLNVKRVHRLWKEEKLQLKRRKTRKIKTGTTVPTKAEHLNHVWCLDFCFDACLNGTKLKNLAVIDEKTRECLVLEVGTRLTAKGVIEVLEGAFAEYGVPKFLRSDNGPEFICYALRIWLLLQGCQSKFIDPGSPWQNGHVESFNSRMRAEFLDAEAFVNLADAQMKAAVWRRFYNEERPHSSLGYETPAQAAARFRDSGRATPSLHPEISRPVNRRN